MKKVLLFVLIVWLGLSYVAQAEDRFCIAVERVQEKMCSAQTVEPEICGVIDWYSMADLLRPYFGTTFMPPVLALWDREFQLISVKNMRKFLALPENKVYINNTQVWWDYADCDDYVRVLIGKMLAWQPSLAVGITAINWCCDSEGSMFRHAVITFVDCNLDVWVIEPQGNIIYSLKDPVDFILMINGE